MSLHLHWFLPTAGDSRDIVGWGATHGGTSGRAPDLRYLTQVAQAAERAGFEAVLTPTGTFCEDAWISTAALLSVTERLRFLVAFRPGLLSPTLAAQQAATYQAISGGRLMLNVVSGGSSVEQRRFGDHLAHDERYDRCAEFLQILRGAWTGEGFDFTGDHYEVEQALVQHPPTPTPPIFFGGSSDAGKSVAARFADVWLMWGEPPDAAAVELASVRALAAAAGRQDLGFGIRLHVITRDTAEEAWAVAGRLVDAIPPGAIDESQAMISGRSDSVGQARMAALHGGRTDDLVVAPNLWAGFGLVRGGAGTALVGSHAEVADRIVEYHDLGFDHFILSGQPHLEEAYWFGEGVRPLLAERGVLDPTEASDVDAPAAAAQAP